MPGATTNFGWAYPLNTDPLADGAQEIQNFADAADTDFAGLLGGTTGQALVKDSATDLDFSWQNIGTPFLPKVSGVYYECFATGAAALTVTEDMTYYAPIFISQSTEVFDRIIVFTGAHTGTSTIRLGIYNMGQGVPTTVVLDAGTVSATAANTAYQITINQTLKAGWYWLASNVQTRTGTQNMTVATSQNLFAKNWGVRTTTFPSDNTTMRAYYTEAGVTGTFATAGTLTAVNQATLIGLRYA